MMKKTSSLTPDTLAIVINKGTEKPYTGEYEEIDQAGSYLCRQCGLALFRAESKFHSGCGWPSFDSEIKGAVSHLPDADGRRTEILCARCSAHLGHVFTGEQHTALNVRHCVNSASLDFVSDREVTDTAEAILAAGCFWGVEYYLKKLPGVLKTQVGYTGGKKTYPSYNDVCSGSTGHVEAIRVVYDPKKLSYESLIKYFFEIHDPTQTNGQGPDLGWQYLSVIFYYDEHEKKISENLIQTLKEKGFPVATRLLPVSVFWPAEIYHQDYYTKNKKEPYCHRYEKKF